MPQSIKSALTWAREVLDKVGPDLAGDAEYLLSFVCQRNRAFIYTHPEYSLSSKDCQTFQKLIQRRALGEPVAYLLGEKAFWSLTLLVAPGVLIPRPETELLVEETLKRLPENKVCHILDIGTGSGAIALALAHSRPHWHITAVDISKEALAIARKNRARYQLANVRLLQSDLYRSLSTEECFDAIVSNPPYIEENDQHLEQGDLRFEPRNALASGEDGLTAIRQIIKEAPAHLHTNGFLLLEHGYLQGNAVRTLLKKHGFDCIETKRDLQGHERLTFGNTPV